MTRSSLVSPGELLPRLEAYYDAVPRSVTRVETLGPLNLFVAEHSTFPYYARPAMKATSIAADDVLRVRRRQRELGVPEAFEWVSETTPCLRQAVEAAGLAVHDHPLMVLEGPAEGAGPVTAGFEVRLVAPDDDLGLMRTVADIGFGVGGTGVGAEGLGALLRAGPGCDPLQIGYDRARLGSGHVVIAAALLRGTPVAVGTHRPVGSVTEVVGVATLPAFRRRGLAGVVTAELVSDALRRGIDTVFLSADSDEVARIYGRLGFRRVGTACIAEASGEDPGQDGAPDPEGPSA